MTDKVYRQAFDQAKADLSRAMERKARAEREAQEAQDETIQLRRTVTALAALCGENVEDSMALTEAVRTLFGVAGSTWITLKDIKDQVEALGCSLADLKNPDASVLSVLNRLKAGNEIMTATKKYKTQAGGVTDVKVWKARVTPTESTPLTDDDIPF